MSIGISAVDTVIMLWKGMSGKEKQQVLKAIGEEIPICQREGHKLRAVYTKIYLFGMSSTKMVCMQCGKKVWA